MKTRLFIENNEIELTDEVSFSINKQFENVSNPTTIINDWSKTVQLPMTQHNNRIFNHLYNPDRVNGDGDGMFVHFDPLKKLDFRLEWNEFVIMTGYAKVNSVSKTGTKGNYNITLNGQLGKIFQEMKKLTFDVKAYDETYIIPGWDYVNTDITMNLVKDSWEKAGQSNLPIEECGVTDIIGFAPNNAFSTNFDYKTYEKGEGEFLKFETALEEVGIQAATGVESGSIIPNGMKPRDIGEFRSYNQIPYIWFNKLFTIFQKKSEDLTGYTFKLDSDWFNTANPYWYNLVFCLEQLMPKDDMTYINKYYGDDNTITGTYNTATYSRYGYELTGDLSSGTVSASSKLLFNIENENIDAYTGDDEGTFNNSFSNDNEIVKGTIDIDSSLTFQLNRTFDTNTLVRLSPNVGIEFSICVSNDNFVSSEIVKMIVVGEGSTIDTSGYDFVKVLNNQYVRYNGDVIVVDLSVYGLNFRSFVINKDNPEFKFYTFAKFIDNQTSSINYLSVMQYKTSSSWGAVAIGNMSIHTSLKNLILNVTPIKGKSRSRFILNDLWNKDVNVFEQILNYCKMYRILIYIDDSTKEIVFEPAYKYFKRYSISDWTDKVDKSKEYIVSPITFDNKYVLFNYEDNKTKIGEEYKQNHTVGYGEFKVDTEYNFNTSTTNLFSGVKPVAVYTPNVLSWVNLYDNKTILYSLPSEKYLDCSDKDNKYVNCFGKMLFHNGLSHFDGDDYLNMRPVFLSDDSETQQRLETYVYSQFSNNINVDTYPNLDIKRLHKGVYIYSTFGIPATNYTYENNVQSEKYGVYRSMWKKYITERYSKNNKLVTCYVKLSQMDFINFEYNKFVTIDNQLYFVNKIYDFDISSNTTTKVDLITISDVSGYNDVEYDDLLSPKTITMTNDYGGYVSGNIDDDTRVFSYILSYYDINLPNGTKEETIGGLKFTISPTSKIVSGVEYNYKLEYKKVAKYNLDNETEYDVNISSDYDDVDVTFVRYRDYPNPPVMDIIIDNQMIPVGTGQFEIRVQTQYPPESTISYGSIADLYIDTAVEWDYHNDDYVYYSALVNYRNNRISSPTATTISVTSGSGYVLTKGVGVDSGVDELVFANSQGQYNPYIPGNIDNTDDYSHRYDYVYSVSELTFYDNTTVKTIGGVEFCIRPTLFKVSGQEYNYEIVYKKVNTYGLTTDTQCSFTVKNTTYNKDLKFIRYSDYPNPPVLTVSGDNQGTIPLGSTDIYIELQTQFEPMSISVVLDGTQSGKVIYSVTDWDYHNDDYVYYSCNVTIKNNQTGTLGTQGTVKFVVVSGAGTTVESQEYDLFKGRNIIINTATITPEIQVPSRVSVLSDDE